MTSKAAEGALAPGTTVGRRYRVIEPISDGPLSLVYQVEHIHTGERLAMKVPRGHARTDPEAIERFKREARTSSRIRSEYVVRVTDADTAPELGGIPFLVMELLNGSDLESYAEAHGPLAPPFVARVLGEVGSAIGQAHCLAIVHRDLKPANVFLHERADGTTVAKVLDFGISKFLADDAVGVTSTGAVLGTPLYMAPEQAHGKNDAIGPTTDVWAIGMIALRLLVGEHYWGRPTMAELMTKIATSAIAPPSERWPALVTKEFDAWFLRSCARDARARFPTVEEQVSALAAALGGENVGLLDTELARRPERRTSRSLALALGLVGLGAISLLRLRAKPDAESIVKSPEPLTSMATPSPTPTPDPPAPSAAAATSPRPPPRATAKAAAPAKSAEPLVVCGSGEVLSSGHCCPSAHVWQSGACVRPIATSF